MSEFLMIKNLFTCAHEKSVEELRKVADSLLVLKEKDYKKESQVKVLEEEKERETTNEVIHKEEKESNKYEQMKEYVDANKNNILHFAVYGNQIDNVKWIVENGNFINSYNKDLQNALFISILNKNTEISKYLIKNGIDYNQIDKFGCNPLLYSLISEDFEIFNTLVEKPDVNININSKEKGNLLGISIFNRNMKIIKKLFQKNVCPTVEHNAYPHPLLFIAYSMDNEMLYLYLSYALYYYTKHSEWFQINQTNFDDTVEVVRIDLGNKSVVDSILENPKYELIHFEQLLQIKDETNCSLLEICRNVQNETGEKILHYFTKSNSS